MPEDGRSLSEPRRWPEALRSRSRPSRSLYVDKLSDKISVIVSDQNTIMDLKGILEGRQK